MKLATVALSLGLALSASAAKNLQNFDGDLGAAAPAVNNVGGDRPFQVDGNAAFDNLNAALVRSCDVQNNLCSNAVNSGEVDDVEVADCQAQQDDCIANADAAAAAN
ncbi:hypothetical protein N0V93_006091 [Gnomoniopsis smithogilvyi]|uniref:Uncharacterized protein n=1 Tax=Gnomoniopsis smithogilvyi TaxID=1191159 RepID=A0A9W8YMM1_9PEZI|nr:hypothetical protein N0V93_006091 [Gnomoniopsis smithogilvyi]